MTSRTFSRTFAALAVTMLVSLSPALAQGRSHARPVRTAPAAVAFNLLDFLRAGLQQLQEKIDSVATSTGTTQSDTSGAGVRIDPEGQRAAPAPAPGSTTIDGHP